MQITHVTVLEWTSVATQQYIGLLLALPLLMTFALQSFYSWRRSSDAKSPERALADRIGKAKDFAEICSVFGYVHEEHSVTTEDGYILLLHRIVSGSDSTDTSAQSGAPGKPVVFINHGLLTNSELYMAVPDPRKCLPLVLVNAGYDVWLGNNRYMVIQSSRLWYIDPEIDQREQIFEKSHYERSWVARILGMMTPTSCVQLLIHDLCRTSVLMTSHATTCQTR